MPFSAGLLVPPRDLALPVAARLLTLALLLAPSSCGDIETRPGCPEPGIARECACEGGGSGTQMCQAERVWEACTCDDLDLDFEVDTGDGGGDLDADDPVIDPTPDPDVVEDPDADAIVDPDVSADADADAGGDDATDANADADADAPLVNECDEMTDTCDEHADCIDLDDGYDCTCQEDYVGNGFECFLGTECVPSASICDANAECASFGSVFLCVCNDGYTGDGVTSCTNVDECDSAALNDCDPNADCTDNEGSYECECRAGFDGDGTFCDDINECSGANPCGAGSCTNASPGYNCACDPGYVTTGGFFPTCELIDECTDVALHDCDPNGTCTNGAGLGYDCTCNMGYVESPGTFPTCNVRNECTDGSHTCAPGGTCTNGGSFGYDCNCQQGYETTGGDFPSCSVIDECNLANDPCGPNGECANGTGVGYECTCDAGYLETAGQFPTCQPENECVTGNHSCAPGGTCTNGGGFGYDCNCQQGYETTGGDFPSCSVIDECTLGVDPCGPNGDCTNGAGFGYDCACDAGYLESPGQFPTCQPENECTTGNHTCAPNGTCTNGAGFGYDCNCGAGFVDDGADFSSCVFEDECTTGTHNCGAFGTCVNGTDFGYECACDLGYYQTDETFPTCLSECAGQPDLSRCAWSQPDYYCFSDVCRPLACGDASCNPSGPHFQLADTGQIECRTQDAEPITCCVDGGMLACGQDAEYGLDRSRSGRFDVLGNTVDDLATGLQWTRCPLGRTGNGCSNGANTTVPWAEAVEVCRALSLGGQGDWRLPDRYELASLIDYSTSSAHIDITAFTATSFDWMWTSSTSAASSADAWAVRLNSQVSELPKTENHELRCVRGTPSPLPAVRFTNLAGDPVTAGDMIVVDHYTQLAWARQPQADILGWEAGLAYCDGLTTGGFTDWRLPNPPELESLLDMRRDDYIDLAVFPNATDFFTGTHGIDITLAHLVSTRTGERLWNGSDASSYGRCVRALPRRPHRVFTTSATYTGDLISEANALVHADFPPERAQDAADAICQWHANQVGIGGHFVAAITTSQSGFLAGVDDDDGPWALVDGTPVTTRASAFLDGRLINAFERNELGGLIPDARTAWTGGVFDCSGWTSTAGNGIYGSATSVGNSFRSFGNPGCNQRRSLYCVEVGPGAGPIALPELPGGALLAFTTTNSYTGDLPASGGGGLGSHVRADLLCQASAGVGGHSGTWRAWLSVSGSSAADYFAEHGMDGPWYREDGFLVASSLSDLTDGNGSTGHLNIGPSGAYLTHANNFSEFVWTGTDRTGMTTTNCLNFGSTTGTGTYGRATTHRAAWTAESTRPCDESLRLYCFQETTGSTGGL